MFNNKSLLITGGTGSFGKYFFKHILTHYPKLKKIEILGRNDLKKFKLKNRKNKKKKKK